VRSAAKLRPFSNEIADYAGSRCSYCTARFGRLRDLAVDGGDGLSADAGWKLDRLTMHWLASSNGNRRLADM